MRTLLDMLHVALNVCSLIYLVCLGNLSSFSAFKVIVGLRSSTACAANFKYFADIDECVSLSFTSSTAFLRAYLSDKVCSGLVVRTLTDLEGLRYCETISSALTIEINDPNADYTALYDIKTINGL